MNRIKKYFQLKNNIAFAAAFIIILISGCEKYVIESTVIGPDDPRSFQTDILPILSKYNCTACHGGSVAPDLRADKAYNSLKDGGLVSGTPPESSKLYKKFSPAHSGITLLDVEKQYILYWITQGAKNN